MSVEEFVFHITGQTKTKIRNTSVVIVELRNVRANAHHMRMCRTTIVMNFPGHKFRAIPHKKKRKASEAFKHHREEVTWSSKP